MASPVVFPFKATGAKDVENAFKNIAASAEKGSKATIKSINAQEKAIDKLAKKVSKSASEMEKDRIKSAKTATDQVLQEYEKQAKAAEKLADRMDKAFEKVKGKNKSGVGGTAIGTFLGGMASKAVSAGLDAVTQAARESMKLDEMANRISISARGYGQKAVDKNALRKSFEQTAINTPGVSSEDVAAGVGGFVSRTGRLDVAQQMQGTFATVAAATGGKFEDIANVGAELFQKFDIKTIEGMRNALAKLTFQGKEGAFELRDAASQFTRLAAAAKSFDIGKGEVATANLGGLTQIAKRSTGSAESAATAVENMFSHLTQNAGTLKQSGVNVFNKDGSSRNIQDILVDSIAGVGKGDMAKKKAGLQQIFGSEGVRAINPLIGIFQEAFLGSKKGGASEQEALAIATKALREEFDKTINVGSSWSEIQVDAAQRAKDASAKLGVAWEKAKSDFADKLLPGLTDALPKLVDPLVAIGGTLLKVGAGLQLLAEKLHLISKTEEKPEDIAAKAKKASEEADAEIERKRAAGEEITDADIENSDRLALNAADAANEANPDFNKKVEGRMASQGRITDEEFIKQYGENNSWFEASSGKDILDKIRSGHMPNEALLQGNETDAQKQLRGQMQEQFAYDKQNNKATQDEQLSTAATQQNTTATNALNATIQNWKPNVGGSGADAGGNGGAGGAAGSEPNTPHD